MCSRRVPSALLLLAPIAASAADPPSVSEHGVGRVTAATPFTRAALAAAFPGLAVIATEAVSEGEPAPVFLIGPPEHPLVVVAGDESRITAVALYRGDRIGRRLFDVIGDPASCAPGLEEAAGTVVCPLPGSATLGVRASGPYDGPDGALPPARILETWTVDRVIWRPAR